jgi:hypothetical protein
VAGSSTVRRWVWCLTVSAFPRSAPRSSRFATTPPGDVTIGAFEEGEGARVAVAEQGEDDAADRVG